MNSPASLVSVITGMGGIGKTALAIESAHQACSRGWFPGSVVYAETAVPRLDTVELDSTHGPEFIDGEAQLAKYRAQLDAAEALALAPPASRDFIRALAEDL